MRVASRVWLALAGFLLIAGAVYGFTGHEYAGTSLLLVGAGVFAYLASIGWVVERSVEGEEPGAEEEPEAQVAPTIWPFAFSIAGLVLVVGLVVSRWIVAVGVVAFAASAAGWLREVVRAHARS
jgi:Cytochrome c oxidase subunit IV